MVGYSTGRAGFDELSARAVPDLLISAIDDSVGSGDRKISPARACRLLIATTLMLIDYFDRNRRRMGASLKKAVQKRLDALTVSFSGAALAALDRHFKAPAEVVNRKIRVGRSRK